MLGHPASVVLTVALLPVVLWCAGCLVRRARHDVADPVPADVEVSHALMGLVMLVALWVPLSRGWAWATAALFVAVTVWSALRLRDGGAPIRGWYRRLGLMAVAMVAMLVPAGAASASPHTGGMEGMAGMDMSTGAGMDGMTTTMGGSSGTSMLLSGVGAAAVAVGMALVGLAALRLVLGPAPRRSRLAACCEVVEAGAMVVMALALV